MVLVTDNASYHHRRKIGTLYNAKKADLCKIIKKFDITYIDLPVSIERIDSFKNGEDPISETVEDKDGFFRVPCDKTHLVEFSKTACKSYPFRQNVLELKLGIFDWLHRYKMEVLHDDVEQNFSKEKFKIFWLPPYCPELMPIKTFWGISKNHVARHYFYGRSMKETITLLRESFYGSDGIDKAKTKIKIIKKRLIIKNWLSSVRR